MGSSVTSGLLAAALNDKVINEAFEIARSNRIGILSSVSMGAPRQAYDGYKMGWLDMRVDATAAATSAAVLVGATTVPVAAGTGSRFRAGMTLSPTGSQEVILVTAVAGDNLTVVRGFGGTTAAALTSGQVLTVDSVARPENSLADLDDIFQPESVENFFQTMDTALDFSRRALSTLQFGNTNDLTFQVAERVRQLAIQLNRALVRGRRASVQIGGKDTTYTGGLRFFLDQAGAIKVDNAAAALTLDAINAVNAEIISRGGSSNTIAVGIKQARKLSALVSANYDSQRLAEWQADAGSVLTLPSDLPLIGNVNRIVVDTNLADDELMIFDSGMISVVPMNANNADASGAWRTLDATQKGQDGQSVRVLGDFAVEFRQSKTHAARMLNIG
jgi:hypothetical protein